MLDLEAGATQLAELAAAAEPPCHAGPYTLHGVIEHSRTALICIASGGLFGSAEGVLKLTVPAYAPLLERELRLLNRCARRGIDGIIRPLASKLVHLPVADAPGVSIAALALPFLDGGDLVNVIGTLATRTGQPGAGLAIHVGLHVAGVLRELLQLPKPVVHRDVRAQNLLLPHPTSPLTELVLIDFDAAVELDLSLEQLGSAPPAVAELLAEDVRGFGELLFQVATGRESGDAAAAPRMDNPPFAALLRRCLSSDGHGHGYVCLADEGLWRDLQHALDHELAGAGGRRGR